MNLISEFIDINRALINERNKYKTVVLGAYGLAATLKYRHNIQGVVNTQNFNLAVSTDRGTMSARELFDLWSGRAAQIAREHRLRWKSRRLNPAPIEGVRSFYSIEIGAGQGPPVITILICDREIEIDPVLSEQVGLPIQKEEDYLRDLFSLIKRGNVSGVDQHTFNERNPVTGREPLKGRKDIARAQYFCQLSREGLERFRPYCDFLATVTIERLEKMTPEMREAFFAKLFVAQK